MFKNAISKYQIIRKNYVRNVTQYGVLLSAEDQILIEQIYIISQDDRSSWRAGFIELIGQIEITFKTGELAEETKL